MTKLMNINELLEGYVEVRKLDSALDVWSTLIEIEDKTNKETLFDNFGWNLVEATINEVLGGLGEDEYIEDAVYEYEEKYFKKVEKTLRELDPKHFDFMFGAQEIEISKVFFNTCDNQKHLMLHLSVIIDDGIEDAGRINIAFGDGWEYDNAKFHINLNGTFLNTLDEYIKNINEMKLTFCR